jgi:GTPase SAR1 family protein
MSINRLYYKACAACILVYDLTKPETLDRLSVWLEEFMQHAQDPEGGQQVTFMVLGNKLDKLQSMPRLNGSIIENSQQNNSLTERKVALNQTEIENMQKGSFETRPSEANEINIFAADLIEQNERNIRDWCIEHAKKYKIEIGFMFVSARTGQNISNAF